MRELRRVLTVLVTVAAAVAFSATPATAGPQLNIGVLTWGSNSVGQLGIGTVGGASQTPVVPIGLRADVVQVSAGSAHSLALRGDGTVWAWGANLHGEVGDGTDFPAFSPVAVVRTTDVVQVAAGSHFSLALRANGTVLAWGSNRFGQLGDATYTDRLTPVTALFFPATQIAAGDSFSVALSDGTAWEWGADDQAHTPVPFLKVVVNVRDFTQLSAHDIGLAIRADGTVWRWEPQRDPATPDRLHAFQQAGLHDIIQVDAGNGTYTAVGPTPPPGEIAQ